ncbi:MAG: DMT family transporter [Gammaproteobacteria bacterium]
MLDLAILFAILSLVFGGLNEVVFKRYSAVERSRGMMICGIGTVWTALLIVDVTLRQEAFLFNRETWSFGLVAGISVAAANIMLLEALRHMEVSLGSTIYRLNTIAVVILAVVFLGESLSLLKLAGIALGVVAVLLLYRHQNTSDRHPMLNTGLVIVIAGASLRAAYSVVTKAGLSEGANADALILISSVCWIISGILYAIMIERRYAITRQKVAYSLLSGVLVYAIVKTLVSALKLGEASVVVTIANLSFLVALLVAIVMKMEALSGKKIAAMGFAVSAIILLTQA